MQGNLERRARQTLLTCSRGLLKAIVAPVGIPLFALSVASIAYMAIGIGFLSGPAAVLGVRGLAEQQRRWAWEWSGVRIVSPYRRRPPAGSTRGLRGRVRLCGWLLSDPATWRDLLWSLINVPVTIFLGVLPTALILNGVEGVLIAPWAWIFSPGHQLYWLLSIPLGVVCLATGLTASPWILRGHALFAQALLAPTRQELAERVDELTESRSDVVDASAAELRRIERDLHDGAQARLVSLGLNIGLAERLLKEDPDAAMALLTEARLSSGQALSELRGLVRGIHPPVLAERGLDGAVQALALTVPIPVDVHVDLPERAAAPVESAVYFAIAEALANVVKHSSATRAWVQVQHDHGKLTAVVGDNGVGGALPGPEGGLRGIERRLGAFDGIAAVTSPSGGPTVVTMELPCELSSART
jgi:signal transduction histidine kinase